MMMLNKMLRLRKPFYVSVRHISGLNLWNEELSVDVKHKIEQHWSKEIQSKGFNEENLNKKEKYYVLSMFPYPSGQLHMGHVRVYTISDAIARFQRMNGKNVIHPIGWDAFGLPAENAAIERNIPPEEWTKNNINQMKEQLIKLGCSFDWEREISTCDPAYYKFTQELFIKLYEKGLVYQKEAYVNWDPVDKTVLADEQVDENGCSWRSGAKVEKKLLKQWFIKTTKFAKNLLDGLDDTILQDWRDIIKLQRHWIGECNGVNLEFNIKGDNKEETLTVFTEHPEYVEQAKFVLISPQYLNNKNFFSSTKSTIINPFNGQELPVIVSDSIENEEARLGIPLINENDRLIAEKNNIAFNFSTQEDTSNLKLTSKEEILSKGGYYTSAKLRDWLISRQRYWGTPIPIIHCKKCGPILDKNLPVILPKILKNQKIEKGKLSFSPKKLLVNCPKCGDNTAQRETDTMDTFVDSSWYFLRYIDPKNVKEMFCKRKANLMTPVDLYIGGKEHAVLHLYYARFINHFLHSLGLLPEREPFKRLLVQGMVMGRSFRLKGSGQYLPPNQVNILDAKKNKAVDKLSGAPVVMQWEKMSKSKFNGVSPSEMFDEYSVDTIRLLMLADVAPTSHRNWNSNTFPGILQWQRRLWLTIKDFIKHRTQQESLPEIAKEVFEEQENYMFDSRNFYVKGATFNYCNSQQISVAISKMQGLTNSLRRAPPAVFARGRQFERALACQIIMLAPIAPHFASELWSGFLSAPHRLNTQEDEISWDKSVLEQKWPNLDVNYNLDLVINVNSEEVGVIKIPKHELEKITHEKALKLALDDQKTQEFLQNRDVLKSSYVFHENYEGVLNISVKRIPTNNKKELKEKDKNENDEDVCRANV